jgi:hypothetical protein
MGEILHCYSVVVRSYPLFLPIWVENDLPEATDMLENVVGLCGAPVAYEHCQYYKIPKLLLHETLVFNKPNEIVVEVYVIASRPVQPIRTRRLWKKP